MGKAPQMAAGRASSCTVAVITHASWGASVLCLYQAFQLQRPHQKEIWKKRDIFPFSPPPSLSNPLSGTSGSPNAENEALFFFLNHTLLLLLLLLLLGDSCSLFSENNFYPFIYLLTSPVCVQDRLKEIPSAFFFF